ncbi:hypothetical protein LXL04_033918 [Taraxacum kok-saghyz]
MTSDARHVRFSGRCDSDKTIVTYDIDRRKLWSTLGAPPDFHDRDPALFEPFDLPIHDLHRVFHKVEFLVDLNFFQGNNQCLIRQTLLEI